MFMGYISEFFIYNKAKDTYKLYGRLPVDNVSALKIGETFTITSRRGNDRTFYIESINHIYYRKEKEYFTQFFLKKI